MVSYSEVVVAAVVAPEDVGTAARGELIVRVKVGDGVGEDAGVAGVGCAVWGG
jgi:hypothetical protein